MVSHTALGVGSLATVVSCKLVARASAAQQDPRYSGLCPTDHCNHCVPIHSKQAQPLEQEPCSTHAEHSLCEWGMVYCVFVCVYEEKRVCVICVVCVCVCVCVSVCACVCVCV